MCGIFGIISGHCNIDVDNVQQALTAIRHRGPDDEGYLLMNTKCGSVTSCGGRDTDPQLNLTNISCYADQEFNIALGHRRLSILDLSSAGHQPMASADKRCWITFNGEIYNYLELRAELDKEGYSFQTGTDTEVLLAAYQQWGAAMLKRLVGMFAFAILDLEKQSVFIVRDSFGIKPLYYTIIDNGIAFASEIKALLELQSVSRRVDAQQLYQYLRFGLADSGNDTLFLGIKQLPAAHYIELKLDAPASVDPIPYWKLDLSHKIDIPFVEAVSTVQSLFEDSVRLHLRSDVPVGSCFSGGLDSTAIVLTMRKFLTDEQDLHTFSFITDDLAYGEEKYVDMVIERNNLIAHKVKPEADELITDLDKLVMTQEIPFGSTSIYAQYRVFRLAHEAGIKVMLDGQGSDEIFGGYYTAISAQIASELRRGRLGAAVNLFKAAPIIVRGYRRRLMLAALGRLVPAPLVARLMALVGESLYPVWMNVNWFMEQGIDAQPRAYGRGTEILRKELIDSITETTLPQLLRYEDRNSMAFSIESRVPFCNPTLATFALSLPSSYLLSPQAITKSIFREATRQIVPPVIIDRPKVGFAVPEQDWLRELRPWVQQTLESDEAKALPFINYDRMREMITSAMETNGFFDYYTWRLLNIIHWSRVFQVQWG